MKRKNEAAWVESAQRWQINVQKDGKRRTFVSSKQNSRPDCKKGKIEAEKKADKWLESATLDEGTKCSVLLDKFLEEVKTRTGTSNSVQTEKFIRIYIKPAIGNVKMKDLTEGHLQSILNKARGHGKTNEGEHLAEKTLSLFISIGILGGSTLLRRTYEDPDLFADGSRLFYHVHMTRVQGLEAAYGHTQLKRLIHAITPSDNVDLAASHCGESRLVSLNGNSRAAG